MTPRALLLGQETGPVHRLRAISAKDGDSGSIGCPVCASSASGEAGDPGRVV